MRAIFPGRNNFAGGRAIAGGFVLAPGSFEWMGSAVLCLATATIHVYGLLLAHCRLEINTSGLKHEKECCSEFRSMVVDGCFDAAPAPAGVFAKRCQP